MQAIVLAAGKGKRMDSQKINKVLLPLAGRPMISYTRAFLKKLGIRDIIVVVGFKKESVKNLLGNSVLYAQQRRQLGTANAVKLALQKKKTRKGDFLILNGDDSAFYTPQILSELIAINKRKKADISILTVVLTNPMGLGRVVRTKQGMIVGIVEEKDAVQQQLKISEVNTGCYIVKRAILEKYLPRIKKSLVTGEYYFTDIVSLVAKDRGRIESLNIPSKFWQGVNTLEEYKKADKAMRAKLNL